MQYLPGRFDPGHSKLVRLFWLSLLVATLRVYPFTGRAQVPADQVGDPLPDTAKRAEDSLGGGLPAPGKDAKAAVSQGFEGGIMPPSGWVLITTNASETWQVEASFPYSGAYRALVYDDPYLEPQDEVLLSPFFSADAGSVSFWSYGSLYWCRDDHDNCDLQVWYVKGDWGSGDDVMLGLADEDWSGTWEWSASTFDFSEHADGEPARIAFRYSGQDGAEIALDEVDIHFGSSDVCSDPYEDNDSPEQATPLDFGETLDGVDICPAGDADFYSFEASAGVTIMVDIDAQSLGSLLDSHLYLYDTDGVTELTQNDDWHGFDSYLEYTLPADGMYFLKVVEFNHGSQGGGDFFYTISLSGTGLGVGPLQFLSHTVDDDLLDESSGNGDGIANCGEQIELYVELFDNGSQTAEAVTAAISTSDPYITWLGNTTSNYGDIPGWAAASNLDDFEILVDPSTPNGHMVHFDLEIQAANDGPWQDTFDLPVVCTSTPAQWTFLVYLVGDNNLEDAAVDDFLEMASVGSNGDLNIVVQFDRIEGYDARYGDWTGTKRFLVSSGMTPAASYALVDIGEANMGDASTLVDFVQWGTGYFPAQRFALVIWDHGSGWRYRIWEQPLFKDVGYDDTSGHDGLDMPELLSVMDSVTAGGAEPIDLVGFDACLMAMIEVDNQLIPYASVRVGSEENEPWDGWDYEVSLGALASNPAMPASELGTVIVEDYYASYGNNYTQSALDLGSAYAQLNTAVNNFALALMSAVETNAYAILKARNSTQNFANASYIDLYDFAYQISNHVDDGALGAAAGEVMGAVSNTVIYERHGTYWPRAHGASIYFPKTEGYYNSLYDGDQGFLQFTAATFWDEWLHEYYAHTSTCFDLHEANNSPEQAAGISFGETVRDAEICPAGDQDFYKFSGSAGDRIIADIDAAVLGSVLDSYLTLFDRDGTTALTSNDDSDSRDSRLSYVLPQDGEYYLRVREYNHPYEGGAGYFYQLTLSLLPPPLEISANRSALPPTIDGLINAWEWQDAATYDITLVASQTTPPNSGDLKGVVDIQAGVLPLAALRESALASTVTLYVMNDHSHLYLAIDNPNDITPDGSDQIGVYFDDNPLPSDGRWTNTTCGNPDGEGNYWVVGNEVQFREWIAGPLTCGLVKPAPGAAGAIGHSSGHAQVELAIDMKSAALRASPGDAIMAYFWIFNQSSYAYEGMWPQTADFYGPATYGRLTLASKSGQWRYFPLLFK